MNQELSQQRLSRKGSKEARDGLLWVLSTFASKHSYDLVDVKHIFISVDVCEFVAAEADTIVYESCMHACMHACMHT